MRIGESRLQTTNGERLSSKAALPTCVTRLLTNQSPGRAVDAAGLRNDWTPADSRWLPETNTPRNRNRRKSMQEELTPAASALSQPAIARRINRYLQLEDCAKCLTLFSDWDDQGCCIYKMTEHFTDPTGPLIKLLTKRRQGLHVSLGSPCGPTVEGGASLVLYKLLQATGLPNLVTLDLRKQSISIFDFLQLYRPRPSTEDETMLPCLQKIAVNVKMDLEGVAEHYPPLAEPKNVRSMTVFLRGRYKYPQTDRFIETWDFTRKFTLAGDLCEEDYKLQEQYRKFSMPTVQTISMAANVYESLRWTFPHVYPNLKKLVITDIRDATVPVVDDRERRWLSNVQIEFSGKRKFRLPGAVESCAKCGDVEGVRFKWNVGLGGDGTQAAYEDQSLVLLSCTTMAIADRRIDPVDVSLVYLQGRPAALDRENSSGKLSAAEELISTRYTEIRHLIFEACKEGAYEHENELLSELATFCKDKFLKLLALCKASLTRLEISAEFCFGCSLDSTTDSQIRALEGAFTKVTELSIEPDRHMEFERFKTQPVSSEKLESFLRMFPHLTTLRFCAGKWVRWSNLDVLLAACPRLEKLYVGTSIVDVETALQIATAHPVRTLVFDFPEAEVPCNFGGLKNCQETEYLLLRTNCKKEISQTDMMQCFSLLPRLRWLFCIMCRQNRTQVAHLASPVATIPELRTLEYTEPSILATVYPQLDSLFWVDITTK
ncbi:hypothetical protein SprV_0702403900 [Sparganum proliferum]